MTYSARDIATADLTLIEDVEYHIDQRGMVFLDGAVYTLEQVDPELADRELRAAIERYDALCRRPRSREAWRAIAMRLWNAMQGPAPLALLPIGSPKRKAVAKRYHHALGCYAEAASSGRAV